MIYVLKPYDSEFRISIINMLRTLVEKVNQKQDFMAYISRNEIMRNNKIEVLEMKAQ